MGCTLVALILWACILPTAAHRTTYGTLVASRVPKVSRPKHRHAVLPPLPARLHLLLGERWPGGPLPTSKRPLHNTPSRRPTATGHYTAAAAITTVASPFNDTNSHFHEPLTTSTLASIHPNGASRGHPCILFQSPVSPRTSQSALLALGTPGLASIFTPRSRRVLLWPPSPSTARPAEARS